MKRRWHTTILHLTLLLLTSAACLHYAAPAPAYASCSGIPSLLWSYPAEGATNVPTNARLWLVLSQGSGFEVQATLNGREVAASFASAGGVSIEPGELLPNTDYALHLVPISTYTGQPIARMTSSGFDIAFRTGPGASLERSGPPEVGTHSTSPGPSPFATDICSRALWAQDCWDTGVPPLYRFDASEPNAIAWLVQSEGGGRDASLVWPKSCGAPALVQTTAASDCFSIQAIGPAGNLSESTRYCTSESRALAAGSCALGSSDANSSAWLLIVLTVLAIRIRLLVSSTRARTMPS